MKLKTFPGGVHPPDNKHYTSAIPIEEFPIPQKVVIPMSQHTGAPSVPLVKVGEEVKTGQKIAEANAYVSIPQHSSISGKVTKIDTFLNPIGAMSLAIEITGDGSDSWIDLVDEPDFMNLPVEEIKNSLKEAGFSGIGGVCIPTIVILSILED